MSISRINFKYDNQQGTVHSGENLWKQSKVKSFREFAKYLFSVCLIWVLDVFGVAISISWINFKYDNLQGTIATIQWWKSWNIVHMLNFDKFLDCESNQTVWQDFSIMVKIPMISNSRSSNRTVWQDHSGRLAWKSFLSTIDVPPGSSGVSNEAKSFTKHATGGLVR